MKYDKIMMDTAKLWAGKSYCKRKKVGAVLSKENRILATGYNGTISGQENKCEDEKLYFDGQEITSIFDVIENVKFKFQRRYIDELVYFVKIRITFSNLEPENYYFYLSEEDYNDLKERLKGKSSLEKLKRFALEYFGASNLEFFIIYFLNEKHNIERKMVTNELTLHAEQNIISFCAKNGIPTEGTTMYITLSPCKTCAKLIKQCGIKEVVYNEEYRDTSGIEFLKSVGVNVRKI